MEPALNQLPLPSGVTSTRLWQISLGRTEAEPLRQAFQGMRARAALLVGEIHRHLPGYTVHDITHLDALWEMAELVAGPDVPLTPAEGFVLGGAILLHDAAMSLAAYPGGFAEIEVTEGWRDLVTSRLQRKLGRAPTSDEIRQIEGGERDEALGVFLRDNHAVQAERLASARWRYRDEDHYLLEVSDLRHHYGYNIGRVAHSHHWSVSRVGKELDETLGAPGGLPADWTVDLLKVAILLRCADAIHLDDRRSPRFLAALRGLTGLSAEHWAFQGRLLRHTVSDGRLRMSAGSPFGLDERRAWWRGYEAAQMVDGELRRCDALLVDTRRPPLAARGVAGAEDPQRFARYVRPQGWEPVQTRVRVSDVPALVERLGGRALYGDDPTVPLRELLQNAIDAVRARRVMEKRAETWGEIHVRTGADGQGRWLEVEDTGVGMSDEVLTGPLLDFGASYWSSSLVREELPGLLAGGFEPIGEFGIGFFSVFMWGDRVQITTRPVAEGARTRVLEFETGPRADPVLREATSAERLRDPGTRVRVWLRGGSGGEPTGYGRSGTDGPDATAARRAWSTWPLDRRVAWLCPTSEVTIYTETGGARRVEAVSANDWLTLPAQQLIDRLTGKGPVSASHAARWPPTDWHLLPVQRGDRVLGRAGLHVPAEVNGAGVLTVGGLRAMEALHVAGVLLGTTESARRDEARPLATADELRPWAEAQADQWARSDASPLRQHAVAGLLRWCGVSTGALPVALSREGWLTEAALAGWLQARSSVLVTYLGDDARGGLGADAGGPRPPPDLTLSDDVLMIAFEDDLSEPPERFQRVIEALLGDSRGPRLGTRTGLQALIEEVACRVWAGGGAALRADNLRRVPGEHPVIGTRGGREVTAFAVQLVRPTI